MEGHHRSQACRKATCGRNQLLTGLKKIIHNLKARSELPLCFKE